jgi:hypothetical protein
MSTDDSLLPNEIEPLKAMIAQQSAALAEREKIIAAHLALIALREETIVKHSETIARHSETIVKHQVVIDSQHDTIEKQLKKLESLHQQLARLLRRQYGPQKERIDPDQLTLFTAEELIQLASELEQGTVDSVSTDDGSSREEPPAEEPTSPATASSEKPKRKGHGRRPLSDHLPRETVVHELTEENVFAPAAASCERRSEASSVSNWNSFRPN